MKNKSLLIGLGVLTVLIIGVVSWWFSVSNTEVRLVNRGEAQQQVCEAYFDKMWKILQQKAGVTDQYKNSFKEVYTPLIEGRYSGEKGQSLMKWIKESNPQFDVSLYKDLMASIEGERNGFFIEQEKLIDIDRQHKDLIMTFPNSIVVGNRPNLEYKIIKSLKTDEVYKTGQENDVDLFKK
jgi:hypothetical protein